MKYTIEMLKDKLPSSVYKALKSDKASELLKATKEEIDKACKALDCTPPSQWTPISYRKFEDREIQAVESCVVACGMFGKSMQFNLKNLDPVYIPIGHSATERDWKVGQEVDMHSIKLMELRCKEDTRLIILPIDAKEHPCFPEKKVTLEEATFRNKMWGKVFHMLQEIGFEVKDTRLNPFSYMHLY